MRHLFAPDRPRHWDQDWLQTPDDIRFGYTHAIDTDDRGNVYLLHTVHETSRCRDAVCVYDASGKFLRSWGETFAGSGHGLHLHPRGRPDCVFITDLKRGLYKTTLDGEVLWHVPKPAFYDDRPHLSYEPTNVAVTPDGQVFLTDGYGSYLVHHFDPDGRLVNVFGGPGLGDHHLAHPHGILYTERRGEPELLVAENVATRLNYLSLSGEHRGFIDVPTRRPRHFAEVGPWLVVPDFYGRVTLIDGQDRRVAHLGDTWQSHEHARTLEADPPDQGFIHPHDAAVTSDGALLVCEFVPTGRVNRITPAASEDR
ncbi:MAG: hypothetical protein AAGG38_01765 [Planctomycetota bacterium]